MGLRTIGRGLLVKLIGAGLLTLLVQLGGLAAQPALAGTAPNLLDKNFGSVVSPLLVHNLYWDTSWDADNPGLSMAGIDDATAAMASSGYFSKLGQYGVSAAAFTGSNQADPTCGTAGASVDYFAISGFVLCEKHKFNLAPLGDQSTIYLVYAPLSTAFSMAGVNSCTSSAGGIAGFHFQSLPSVFPLDVPQIFGVAFTQCTSTRDNPPAPPGGHGVVTLDGTTVTGSHEIVEAATDPLPPADWIDNSVASFSVGGVLKLFTAGEAGDLCESGVGSPVGGPPTSEFPRVMGSLPSSSYAVAYYWSNSDGACVPMPHTVSLSETGLPFAFASFQFDGFLEPLPFTMTVADRAQHSWSFFTPIPDMTAPNLIRYVTTQPSFSGPITGDVSVTAVYTTQDFLTVSTDPFFLVPSDTTLTASAWEPDGATVTLTTDPIIPGVGTGAGTRYLFKSWEGVANGTNPTTSITMTGPRFVAAAYELQDQVMFTEVGIPAGVPWTVTVAGTTQSGPFSEFIDDGSPLTFAFESPVPDPVAGTQYVLTSTSQPSGFFVTAPVTVLAAYGTQRLLTVATSGLGTTNTHVFNSGALLGTANDSSPLQTFLPDGAALVLSADPDVSLPDGTQLLLSGFSPTPPATLTAPFSTTASYETMSQVIAAALASGGISGPGAAGLANSYTMQWAAVQSDFAAGQYGQALVDITSFISHVDAQSGKKLTTSLANTLDLLALAAYHNALCPALSAAQITSATAASDYTFYSARVIALGGTPLPAC